MKTYRENWYYIGGIIFVVLAFVLSLFGGLIDPMRRIMTVMFMCLLIHQFEEYAVPGGFPSAWNIGVSGQKELGDRYPLNTKSCFIVNICCGYSVYILGIIFSNVHVISILIAFFTLAQIPMHGIIINKKMGTLYNPGVATSLFLMLPVSIYNLWYTATNFNIPTWNWWVALILLPFVAFSTILLPILKCQDKESPYAFIERDVKGFSVKGKVARIRRGI